jgi:hypothetical protein
VKEREGGRDVMDRDRETEEEEREREGERVASRCSVSPSCAIFSKLLHNAMKESCPEENTP